MKIYGREIKFKRTVAATCSVANLCAGGDIGKINQLFSGKYQQSQTQAAKFMAALSEGYENAKVFENADYQPRPLTCEEALSLDSETFDTLFYEAIDAWTGEKPTVETKPPKETGKKKDANAG